MFSLSPQGSDLICKLGIGIGNQEQGTKEQIEWQRTCR
jgi:hypothetical protein